MSEEDSAPTTLEVNLAMSMSNGWVLQHSAGFAFLPKTVDPQGSVIAELKGLNPPVYIKCVIVDDVIQRLVAFTEQEQKDTSMKLQAKMLGMEVDQAQDLMRDMRQWLAASLAVQAVNNRMQGLIDGPEWGEEVTKFLQSALEQIVFTSSKAGVGKALHEWVSDLVHESTNLVAQTLGRDMQTLQDSRDLLAARCNMYADLINSTRGLIDPTDDDDA